MKKLLIIILVLAFVYSINAQDTEIPSTKKNEFGLNAGGTTGLGFSYRRWIGKAGIQLTGLPIKTPDLTFISMGITGLYTFYDSRHVRVYGFLGNHYIINNKKTTDDYYNNGNYTTETTITEDEAYNIGFGPGFSFGTVVRFNLMVGYGFYDIMDSSKMFPTAEIGLYYTFGEK